MGFASLKANADTLAFAVVPRARRSSRSLLVDFVSGVVHRTHHFASSLEDDPTDREFCAFVHLFLGGEIHDAVRSLVKAPDVLGQ
jgi:hypothetical protein